jgi:hypothetical protein
MQLGPDAVPHEFLHDGNPFETTCRSTVPQTSNNRFPARTC